MEELRLRPPEPCDAAALLEAVRESLAELQPWMAWCHPGFALADAERWIAGQPAARAAGTEYEFLVLDRRDRLLGVCALNGIHREYRFANLGYWVRTAATGRGVATRAVGLLAEWAFAHTELERLEIVVAAGNAASQTVAVKAGARREGLLRSRLRLHGRYHDAVLFSLLRSDAAAGSRRLGRSDPAAE